MPDLFAEILAAAFGAAVAWYWGRDARKPRAKRVIDSYSIRQRLLRN